MRRLLVILILSAISFLAARAGGLVYRRYLPDKIITLDPLISLERYSQSVILQIYDPLFKTEDGIVPKPHIAKSFAYDPQNKTYQIFLRTDVHFHDGRKLTSDDVVFTLKRMCLYPEGTVMVLPLIAGCRSQGEFGVRTSGPFQVSIKLLKDFPPFTSFLASSRFMILPKDLNGKTEEEFFKNPVGTGPFIMESRNDNSVVLKGNKAYFLGSPQVKKQFYYTEPHERIYSRVQEGTIDDIFPLPPPEEYSDRYEKVFVNQASSVFLAFQPRVRPFDKKEFRKAIQATINNSEIFRALPRDGSFIPAKGLIPWGAIGFDPSLSADYYNPSSVREWIEKAGFKNMQSVPELELRSVLKYPFDDVIPKIIQNNLQATGFKVRVINQTLPQLMEDMKKNKVGLFLVNITMFSVDTYHFLELWRNSYTHPGLTIDDSEFERLMDEALKSADRYRRMEIYKEANRLITDKTYVHNIGHVVYTVSLRAKQWKFPKMNFLGPFFYPMHDLNYAQER